MSKSARIILLPFGANTSTMYDHVPRLENRQVFDRSAHMSEALRGVTQFGPGRSLYEEDDIMLRMLNGRISDGVDVDIVNYSYSAKQMSYILERLVIARYQIEVYDLIDRDNEHNVLDTWLFDKESLRKTLVLFASVVWRFARGKMELIQDSRPTQTFQPIRTKRTKSFKSRTVRGYRP